MMDKYFLIRMLTMAITPFPSPYFQQKKINIISKHTTTNPFIPPQVSAWFEGNILGNSFKEYEILKTKILLPLKPNLYLPLLKRFLVLGLIQARNETLIYFKNNFPPSNKNNVFGSQNKFFKLFFETFELSKSIRAEGNKLIPLSNNTLRKRIALLQVNIKMLEKLPRGLLKPLKPLGRPNNFIAYNKSLKRLYAELMLARDSNNQKQTLTLLRRIRIIQNNYKYQIQQKDHVNFYIKKILLELNDFSKNREGSKDTQINKFFKKRLSLFSWFLKTFGLNFSNPDSFNSLIANPKNQAKFIEGAIIALEEFQIELLRRRMLSYSFFLEKKIVEIKRNNLKGNKIRAIQLIVSLFTSPSFKYIFNPR
jgi:hypothetical protein